MDIRNQSRLVVSCLMTSLLCWDFVAVAKDKEKAKPTHAPAPAAPSHAEPNANRPTHSAPKETPRQHVEVPPRVQHRNDNNPPAASRSIPQGNHGNSPSKRDDTPSDNRLHNNRSATTVIGGSQIANPHPSHNARAERNKIDSTLKLQPEVRVDRRDHNPQGKGNPHAGVIPAGNPPLVSPSMRDSGNIKTDHRDERADRREDSRPMPKPGNTVANQASKDGSNATASPTSPSLGGADGIRARDRRDDNKGDDARDKNRLPKLDIPKNEPGRMGLNQAGNTKSGNPGVSLPYGPPLGGTDGIKGRDHRDGHDKNRDAGDKSSFPKPDLPRIESVRNNFNPSGDATTGVGRGIVNQPGSVSPTLIGKDDIRHRTRPVRVEKNGHVSKSDARHNVVDGKPEVGDRITQLRQTRDHKEFERHLNELKAMPDGRSHAHQAGLKLDRVSGVYQQRLEHHDLRNWHETDVGRRLNLDRQFQLHRHGDLSRQLNLGPSLVQAGGWQHRHHGPVVSTFTQSSVSVWYAGGGYYPRYCWTPRWTPWVNWCWWDTCLPVYDPRPVHCRPIAYNPSPRWVVYEYPVWQPLPVTTCGTWVNVPPVVVDSGTDLQLLATRFVDNGHPDQNLGPRYRVWLRNNGPLSVTIPFNVTLIAANDQVPTSDLPQAGAIVNGIAAGEIQSVDIRLPLAANRLAVTPEGQRVPFGYLHVLVDSHREITESNESNNGAVLARNDILPVDPATFSSDVTAAAPGTVINVAGEGFGPEPGQVIVSINGLQLQAEIHGWYDLGVRFAVPNIALAGATDADILIIRGDGAAANPLDFNLVPQAMLGDSPLPPIPSP